METLPPGGPTGSLKMERNPECGVYKYRPRYLQPLNSMTSFMAFYTALLIVYGMASPYLSTVLPSIERRFGFTSKTIGIILAIMDAGIVVTSLVTAHFGGKGHRPRGIFIGACLCGFSLILFAAPEIFFPIEPTSVLAGVIANEHYGTLCLPSNLPHPVRNETVCELEADGRLGAVVMFGSAAFLLGAGSTSLMILGLPFIDDNTSVDDAPIYFAISFFGRIFGPMLGFGLGGVCNNIFLDGSKPNFKQTDPRWISAWYLGLLVVGAGVILFALFVGCFPHRLATSAKIEQAVKTDVDCVQDLSQACDSAASWRDFVSDLNRLMVNVPFMCRAFSNVFDGMIITGFLSFFFKFIAQQYQISPSVASLAGGVPTIFGIALGVIGGGYLIRKWQLQPRHVCLMLVLSAIVLCAGILVNILLGCERTEVLGVKGSESLYSSYHGYSFQFNGSYCDASAKCDCAESQFIPVCDPKSGVNFYSPCHAGCTSNKTVDEKFFYDNCTCVKNSQWFYDDVETEWLNGRMVGGFCQKDCPNLYAFVAVFFVAMFCLGLPLSGSIMVQYRLVDPDLKSMSTGLISLLTSLLGYLPAPIFVGAVVDSTCRLWQTTTCGDHKSCLLYDTDQFRWKFLLTAACMKIAGAVLDCIVTWKMWDLRFHGPEEPTNTTASMPFSSIMSSARPLPVVADMSEHPIEDAAGNQPPQENVESKL